MQRSIVSIACSLVIFATAASSGAIFRRIGTARCAPKPEAIAGEEKRVPRRSAEARNLYKDQHLLRDSKGGVYRENIRLLIIIIPSD